MNFDKWRLISVATQLVIVFIALLCQFSQTTIVGTAVGGFLSILVVVMVMGNLVAFQLFNEEMYSPGTLWEIVATGCYVIASLGAVGLLVVAVIKAFLGTQLGVEALQLRFLIVGLIFTAGHILKEFDS